MKIGLIGMPNSGKTTIYNALTKQTAEVTPYADSRTEPHIAVVPVEDERVDRLTSMYHPRRTVRASVDFIDFAGLAEGAAKDGSFSARATALLRECDALALVLRVFAHPTMEAPEPLRELERLEEELLLADLILVENRLERIDAQLKRVRSTRQLELEGKTLRVFQAHLMESRPLRELDLTPDESKLTRGFRLFTLKPYLAVLNSDEAGFGRHADLLEAIKSRYPVVEFSGQFEMELAGLGEEDARMFMADMGISASARERLLRLAYMTVGCISFFTVGQDEVRAWNILNGDTALDAAGAIHSDLARGFIRAERFAYEDLISSGSEKSVREQGRMSLEGRNYLVRDGDILNIRFSV